MVWNCAFWTTGTAGAPMSRISLLTSCIPKKGGDKQIMPHISHVRFLSKFLGWHYKCVCEYFHWTFKSANIYIWSAYHLEVGTLQIVSMPTFLDNIFNGRAPGIRYWRPHPIFGYCCHHLLQRHALTNLRVHTFSLNPWFACMLNVHILIFMRAYSYMKFKFKESVSISHVITLLQNRILCNLKRQVSRKHLPENDAKRINILHWYYAISTDQALLTILIMKDRETRKNTIFKSQLFH